MDTSIALDTQPFRVWQGSICDELLNADCPVREVPMGGTVAFTQVAGIVALDLDVRLPGLGIGRTPRRIAREARPEALGLTYVMKGTCVVALEGRELVLRAGDVCLLHSRQPFTKLISPDYREHFLYLPRPVIDPAGRGLPEVRRQVAPPQGLGSLLADTLSSVARRRRELREDDWPPLLSALLHLSEATFGVADEERRERARPAARELQRQRVLRYVEEHLGEPDLSAGTVAAALGMSPRYVHLLFEDTGRSVGETILGLRLSRCRDRLADPAAAHLQIAEIAFAHGFNDSAHFSRAFKARFGLCPRDARARAAT